jgi:hypothetical protein
MLAVCSVRPYSIHSGKQNYPMFCAKVDTPSALKSIKNILQVSPRKREIADAFDEVLEIAKKSLYDATLSVQMLKEVKLFHSTDGNGRIKSLSKGIIESCTETADEIQKIYKDVQFNI